MAKSKAVRAKTADARQPEPKVAKLKKTAKVTQKEADRSKSRSQSPVKVEAKQA